jgi:methanethiol S-methyltransferase
MTSVLEASALYAVLWMSFGLGHSLLAGMETKKRLSHFFGPFYRLSYNLFATAHIAAIWILGLYLFSEAAGFSVPFWAENTLKVFYFAGWALLLVALSEYDLSRLSGTFYIKNHFKGITEQEDEPLHIHGFHRYMRHPLYSGAFLILWGRIDGPFDLATAIFGSLYLVCGTFFEERKLMRVYGKLYQDYRKNVPAFLPWKGRAI